MSLDQEKLNEMLHRGVNDFGATFHAACVAIGDKLGLYKGLAAGGRRPLPDLPIALELRSATFANGFLRKPLAATSRSMQPPGDSV